MKLLGFSQNEQFRKVLTVLVNHGIKTFPPLRNSKEFNSFALNSKSFSLDWIAWQIPVQVKKFDCFKPFRFANFNTLLILWTFSPYFYYSVYSFNFIMYFKLDNDDMESLKPSYLFTSLIFILKCFMKLFVIRNETNDEFLPVFAQFLWSLKFEPIRCINF